MKKIYLLTAVCSLIFGSAVAGEIETAHRYTAPLASVELTAAAVKGSADISGQHMMAGSSAEVQELGGSMTLPAQVRERAEVQELGRETDMMVERNSAEVQDLGHMTATKDRAEVQELGVSISGDARDEAEVQELGSVIVSPKERAEVQELGRASLYNDDVIW